MPNFSVNHLNQAFYEQQGQALNITGTKNSQEANRGNTVTGKEKSFEKHHRIRAFRYVKESEGFGAAVKSLFRKK